MPPFLAVAAFKKAKLLQTLRGGRTKRTLGEPNKVKPDSLHSGQTAFSHCKQTSERSEKACQGPGSQLLPQQGLEQDMRAVAGWAVTRRPEVTEQRREGGMDFRGHGRKV